MSFQLPSPTAQHLPQDRGEVLNRWGREQAMITDSAGCAFEDVEYADTFCHALT